MNTSPCRKLEKLVAPFLTTSAFLCLTAFLLSIFTSHGILLLNSRYSAGQVKVGDVIRHSIIIVNMGTEPARLFVIPSCECTTTDSPSRSIGPLSLNRIVASVKTTKMGPGRNHKYLMMYFLTATTSWRMQADIDFKIQYVKRPVRTNGT
jgi:hypothetical protein